MHEIIKRCLLLIRTITMFSQQRRHPCSILTTTRLLSPLLALLLGCKGLCSRQAEEQMKRNQRMVRHVKRNVSKQAMREKESKRKLQLLQNTRKVNKWLFDELTQWLTLHSSAEFTCSYCAHFTSRGPGFVLFLSLVFIYVHFGILIISRLLTPSLLK